VSGNQADVVTRVGASLQTSRTRCSVWRQPAENVANSLTKGARVVVEGALRQRSFETKDGEKRTVIELDADEVGASLRYATVQVHRTASGGTTNDHSTNRRADHDRRGGAADIRPGTAAPQQVAAGGSARSDDDDF
jgi:single-strand DNA-binding protein